MITDVNPFIYSHPVDPEDVIDRDEETEKLLAQVVGGHFVRLQRFVGWLEQGQERKRQERERQERDTGQACDSPGVVCAQYARYQRPFVELEPYRLFE